MRRLTGGIPRGCRDHRTREGRTYTRHVRALLARLGALPPVALPMLREAGRLVAELEALAADLERARAAKRRRDIARARRAALACTRELVRLEERLEQIAASERFVGRRSLVAILRGDAA